MKLLVLSAAILAVCSASLIGKTSVDFSDNVFRGENEKFIRQNTPIRHGLYDDQMTYGVENIFGTQENYDKTVMSQVFRHVLMTMFDREIVVKILTQEGFLDKDMYRDIPVEKIWDAILTHYGIFDKEVLVDLIRTPALREMMVRYGIFNAFAAEQFLRSYDIKTAYEYDVLEKLVEKTHLKYWLVNERIFNQYWIRQAYGKQMYGDYFYNSELYGQEYLITIMKNNVLRNTLVQYGVFDKYVLDQILSSYTTQGTYSQVFLTKLINKKALWHLLMQYGIDRTTLKYLMVNEIAALNVFLKYRFSQQTPMFTYRQLVGFTKQTPEMVMPFVQHYPYAMEKDYTNTPFKPYTHDYYGFDSTFDSERTGYTPQYTFLNRMMPSYTNDKMNYMRNIIYGQRTDLNHQYNQDYYRGYPMRTFYPGAYY